MKSINYRICYLCVSFFLLSACSNGDGSIDDLLNKKTQNTTNSDDNNNNNQNAAENYEISASETSLSFSADGDSKNISVTTNFTWETISKPSWITISPSSGTKGTTTLSVTASQSTSSTSRTGTITFGKSSSATVSITVSQAAASSSGGSSGSDKTFTVSGNGKTVTFKMIYVQGGTFMMGATAEQGSDADDDEKPAHSVTLSSYSIGETEVTQELWETVMGNNWSYSKGNKHPVNNVTWNECQEFIRKLNSQTGMYFRLPTEAEWEYAARGGKKSKGYMYAGSNSIENVAWYYINSYNVIHDVATKTANELGLYDMSGNVHEWCYDWYDSYSSKAQTNPTGPSTGVERVIRGGRWYNDSYYCRVSSRFAYKPINAGTLLGFRLAL